MVIKPYPNLSNMNNSILTKSFYMALDKKLHESKISLDNLDDNNNEEIEGLIHQLISELSPSLKKLLLTDYHKTLLKKRDLFKSFCDKNVQRWQAGFDLLEVFILICIESGDNFNTAYRPSAFEKNDIVFDIVVKHHARACQIAQEILCLLKSGFPDGAHARWRALHEVTVTALFIAKNGYECAERFYWYEVVESYKGMLQHKRYEHRLNEKGPTNKEIEDCKITYDQLIDKYGRSFGKPYGWAANFINKGRVAFSDIEENVSLDHMRPYYKWASQTIHAGPKGINKTLSLCNSENNILLVGQSSSGMPDPAHGTAIALAQITTALLNIDTTIDRLIVLTIINEITKEIGEVFLKCDIQKL